jgi:hypothetical protein
VFATALTISLALQPATPHAQTTKVSQWKVPRLADGKPDLQGVWDFKTITPLERPKELAGKRLLTDADLASMEKAALDQQTRAQRDREDLDRGLHAVDRRTSLIEDPPDGRLPPLVPGALVQPGSASEDLPTQPPVRYYMGGGGTDGPEQRGLSERCIVGQNTIPAMDPAGYNNNVQIVQTSDYVVIHTEQVHNARIVPLDGRPHIPDTIRLWSGDARGHWEGDTLVVETTNYTDKIPAYELSTHRSARANKGLTALGTGTTLRLIERFSRPSQDILRYEYTVIDPATFTRPFTVMIPMRRLTPEGIKVGAVFASSSERAQIYEYACHEGNHALWNILSTARGVEKQAREKQAKERSAGQGK